MTIPFPRLASIDVDAQKGFTPLCPSELPVPDGGGIVEELNKQAGYAALRIGTKDSHPWNPIWAADSDHPILSPISPEKPGVDVYWPRHCIVGTVGNELLDGLPKVSEYDFFVFKGSEPDMHPYGACYHDLKETLSTGLIEYLRCKRIDTVVLGGLALDFCVKTTAKQLKSADFKVIVNLSATRSLAYGDKKIECINELKTLGIECIESSSDLDK